MSTKGGSKIIKILSREFMNAPLFAITSCTSCAISKNFGKHFIKSRKNITGGFRENSKLCPVALGVGLTQLKTSLTPEWSRTVCSILRLVYYRLSLTIFFIFHVFIFLDPSERSFSLGIFTCYFFFCVNTYVRTYRTSVPIFTPRGLHDVRWGLIFFSMGEAYMTSGRAPRFFTHQFVKNIFKMMLTKLRMSQKKSLVAHQSW